MERSAHSIPSLKTQIFQVRRALLDHSHLGPQNSEAVIQASLKVELYPASVFHSPEAMSWDYTTHAKGVHSTITLPGVFPHLPAQCDKINMFKGLQNLDYSPLQSQIRAAGGGNNTHKQLAVWANLLASQNFNLIP